MRVLRLVEQVTRDVVATCRHFGIHRGQSMTFSGAKASCLPVYDLPDSFLKI